ncbi:hypothetical protein FQR65_LT20920 [Abscondita terminalis]|nr:hypothetical protein FQR65_LT20920 [Abscondita terminalis]
MNYVGEKLVRRAGPRRLTTKEPQAAVWMRTYLPHCAPPVDGWQTRINEMLRASLHSMGRADVAFTARRQLRKSAYRQCRIRRRVRWSCYTAELDFSQRRTDKAPDPARTIHREPSSVPCQRSILRLLEHRPLTALLSSQRKTTVAANHIHGSNAGFAGVRNRRCPWYADGQAVQRHLRTPRDEFTTSMTWVVNLTTPSGKPRCAHLLLRGAHLLADVRPHSGGQGISAAGADLLDKEVAKPASRRPDPAARQGCPRPDRSHAQSHWAKVEAQIVKWEVADDTPPPNPYLRATVKQVGRYPNGIGVCTFICVRSRIRLKVDKAAMRAAASSRKDSIPHRIQEGGQPTVQPLHKGHTVGLNTAHQVAAFMLPDPGQRKITDRLDRLGQMFNSAKQPVCRCLGIRRALSGLHPKTFGMHEADYRKCCQDSIGFLRTSPSHAGVCGMNFWHLYLPP